MLLLTFQLRFDYISVVQFKTIIFIDGVLYRHIEFVVSLSYGSLVLFHFPGQTFLCLVDVKLISYYLYDNYNFYSIACFRSYLFHIEISGLICILTLIIYLIELFPILCNPKVLFTFLNFYEFMNWGGLRIYV